MKSMNIKMYNKYYIDLHRFGVEKKITTPFAGEKETKHMLQSPFRWRLQRGASHPRLRAIRQPILHLGRESSNEICRHPGSGHSRPLHRLGWAPPAPGRSSAVKHHSWALAFGTCIYKRESARRMAACKTVSQPITPLSSICSFLLAAD